jgi:hypothetical protein
MLVSLVGIFVAIIAVIALGAWLASRFHTDFDGTTDSLGGALLLAVTVTRVPAFWDNFKVVFVRRLLGDTGASVFYLLLAGGIIVYGAERLACWSDAVHSCSRSYTAASTPHERGLVLTRPPEVTIPGFLKTFGAPRILTCEQYREHGSF